MLSVRSVWKGCVMVTPMDEPLIRQVSPAQLAPHHDGSALYVSTDRPRLGGIVRVRVRLPVGSGVRTVRVRMVRDAEPAFADAVSEGIVDGEEWFAADVLMHNPVTGYRFMLDRGPLGYSWLNGSGEHHRDVSDAHDFRLTVFDPGPDWAVDGVVYQIFPDRFATSGPKSDLPRWFRPAAWDDTVVFHGPEGPLQFYGGDLDGIRDHLDHLERLGVSAVYLTPIFPARSNHRYNATTFASVDPLLGGDAALVALAGEVHRRGMKIVGDLTTNHSGDDHDWFRAAMADPSAPERSFYYVGEDGGYVSWLGHHTLPKFDLESPELRARMFAEADSVIARWLRPPFELDGWRIDVANMTGRQGAHDHGREVARLIRRTLAAVRPESVLIAEYTNDYTADLVGDGWQGSMNYAGFARPVWSWLASAEYERSQLEFPWRIARRSGPACTASMREFLAAVPWKVALRHWNLIGSHDTPRIRTITGSAVSTRIATALLMTYPGTPMMYSGDELGLEGTTGEDARRPMPWDREESWDRETMDEFRELIALRGAHPALRVGGLRWVIDTDDAIGYLRETRDERILVVVARSAWDGALLPATLAPGGTARRLHGAADLTVAGGALGVPGDGPAAGVWLLP